MSAISDPIADMLTRIRNAARAGLASVDMPHSVMKNEIARILKKEGYIADFSKEKEGPAGIIRILLRYDRDEVPVIRGLRRVSKPGLRRYVASDEIPRVLGGMGVAVLSTSKGILSDKDARRQKVGGELLCFIW
jgi:small subunit ribosomal protein S8